MDITRDNVGDAWQAMTKYDRDAPPRGGLKSGERPEQFKVYETPLKVVALPGPATGGGPGLWDLLKARRTRRTYRPEPLALPELSQVLWAADGKTKEGRGAMLRSAPSAGALYPIELYVMSNDVEGLEKGIYHYDVPGHGLEFIRQGAFGQEAAEGALGQTMPEKSGAVIFMSAIVERCRFKYGQRAYRYIYLDAGHIGQNICLAACSLGLGACPIGAFFDDELNGLLGVDGTGEMVVYAMTIGR